MTRTTHKKVGIVMVPKIQSEQAPRTGKTLFTREEISDIIDLGVVLKKIHNRLKSESALPELVSTKL